MSDLPIFNDITFRFFEGKADYQLMVDVFILCKEVDDFDSVDTAEGWESYFTHFPTGDPRTDVIFAFLDSACIGFCRLYWMEGSKGERLFMHYNVVDPQHRNCGVMEVFCNWCEKRAREVSLELPFEGMETFQAAAYDTEDEWNRVLVQNGYDVFRHGFKLVRPDLENIPEHAFPSGIEVRPVEESHFSKIVAAWNEATKDMRGPVLTNDSWFKTWQEGEDFDPSLWVIAWHGDTVVGTILNYINSKENLENDRKWGYVELISVSTPWRRKGIAKAMIALSLAKHKKRGMEQASLGSDGDSPNQSMRLYQSMGFVPIKRITFYRKSLKGID